MVGVLSKTELPGQKLGRRELGRRELAGKTIADGTVCPGYGTGISPHILDINNTHSQPTT